MNSYKTENDNGSWLAGQPCGILQGVLIRAQTLFSINRPNLHLQLSHSAFIWPTVYYPWPRSNWKLHSTATVVKVTVTNVVQATCKYNIATIVLRAAAIIVEHIGLKDWVMVASYMNSQWCSARSVLRSSHVQGTTPLPGHQLNWKHSWLHTDPNLNKKQHDSLQADQVGSSLLPLYTTLWLVMIYKITTLYTGNGCVHNFTVW